MQVSKPDEAAVVAVNEPAWRRISWGAIIGGVVIAVAIQILLALLGLGIGLNVIDPATDEQAVPSGLGIGAGLWWLFTWLISLFAGGWAAGRLSGVPRHTAGFLQGLVVWAVTTIVMLYFVTTTMGAILGGAFSILRTTATAAGQGVAAVAGPAGEQAGQAVDWSRIRSEAVEILRQTRKPELQPENLQQEAQEALEQTREDLRTAEAEEAEQELQAALDRLFNRASRIASQADKEAVANVLAARTEMSREEAMQRVEQWEETYQGLRGAAGEQVGEAGQTAREMAERATDAAGSAALWTFVALLLGALAAAFGGRSGAPAEVEVVRS